MSTAPEEREAPDQAAGAAPGGGCDPEPGAAGQRSVHQKVEPTSQGADGTHLLNKSHLTIVLVSLAKAALLFLLRCFDHMMAAQSAGNKKHHRNDSLIPCIQCIYPAVLKEQHWLVTKTNNGFNI